MSTKILIYQGHEIVYTDYRMKSREEMIAALEETEDFTKPLESRSEKYLYLLDLRGVPITKEFGERLMATGNNHTDKVMKSAVLGITGIKRMFFKTYLFLSNSKMRSFQDKKEALEYLISK